MKNFIVLHLFYMLLSLLPVSKTYIPSAFDIQDNSIVKNTSRKDCFVSGTENPFRISAIIPHWE